MKLQVLIDEYISFKRSLGYKYKTNEHVLRWFNRHTGIDVKLEEICRENVSKFLDGSGPLTRTWHVKYNALSGLYRYAITRRYVKERPLPLVIPKQPPTITPYIYTVSEIKRLLVAADTYQKNRSATEPITVHTMILLIYGAGLRPHESVTLLAKDVDLFNRVITVRDSKFGKSRVLPIGTQLASALIDYSNQRKMQKYPQSNDMPFFSDRAGNAVNLDTFRGIFQRVRTHANIYRTDGAKYPPRLHDLRHTFAVHRLVSWYREGRDVQKLLHPLSIYLGHVKLVDTQVYLSMTPELLAEANARFQQYALEEICDETN